LQQMQMLPWWYQGVLAVPSLVVLVGLLLMLLGWVGRRVGEHPHCRKCGFDLHGSMGSGGVRPGSCPECGADLSVGRRVVTGLRRRRLSVVGVGLLMVVGGVGAGGALLWVNGQQVNLNQYKPVWLLRNEANRHGTGTSGDALDELVSRLHAGKLSRSQVDGLVSDALVVQGNASTAWDTDWGEIVEQAKDVGWITPADWVAYAETAARSAYTVDVRPRVGRGEPVYRWVRTGRARMSERTGGFHVRTSDAHMLLDGVPQSHWSKGRSSSSAITGRSGGGASGRSIDFDEQAWGDLPAGAYPVAFFQRVEVSRDANRDWQPDGPVIVTFEMTMADRLQLVDESTVAAVVDESLRQGVRDALTVERMEVRHGDEWNYFSGSIRLDHPPVGLAFDVYLRDDQGREVRLGWINEGMQDATTYGLDGQPPTWGEWTDSTADVVLRPSEKAALSSHDVFEYWGEEVVFEDVTVEMVEASP